MEEETNGFAKLIKDLGSKLVIGIIAYSIGSIVGEIKMYNRITGCEKETEIIAHKDVTGDGIEDIIVKACYLDEDGKSLEDHAYVPATYLFIGKKDGGFIRTKKVKGPGVKYQDVEYFISDEGTPYFFDGKIYRESP